MQRKKTVREIIRYLKLNDNGKTQYIPGMKIKLLLEKEITA
jgi:hypothetical protein